MFLESEVSSCEIHGDNSARENQFMPNWDTATYNAFLARRTKLPCPIEASDKDRLSESLQAMTKESRVSTDEEKLNKLERAYLAYLRAKFGAERIGIQNVTLKLAHRCTYTADFSFWSLDGRLALFETKGKFIREDGWIKLKMAARLFPQVKFVLVKRSVTGWEESVVSI